MHHSAWSRAPILYTMLFGALLWRLLSVPLPLIAPGRRNLLPYEVSRLWEPLGGCQPEAWMQSGDSSRKSSLSLPSTGGDYLSGLEAVSTRNIGLAERYFVRAQLEARHPFAVVALANLVLTSAGNDGLDRVIPQLSSAERLLLAQSYLSHILNCRLVGRDDLAREYRTLGLLLLPRGEEGKLGAQLNRRVGESYYYEGRWEEALPWLWRAAPGGYTPLILLAHVLSVEERYAEALPVFARALVYYPNSVELRLGGAQAAEKVGDLSLARWFLEGMQPVEALGLPGLIKLGDLCLAMGDLECAVSQYKAVLDLAPGNMETLARLRDLEGVAP